MTPLPPKISIIVPVMLEVTDIRKTIESCRFQNYGNLEIVVVLANKNTEDYLYSLDDSRIRIIQSKILGYEELLTVGCDFAKGEKLTFIEPGDSQEYDRVKRQSKYHVSLTNIHYEDDDGMVLPRIKYMTRESFRARPDSDNLKTIMLDTDIYTDVGDFDMGLTKWFERYYLELGNRIPILRSRLYRKEKQ